MDQIIQFFTAVPIWEIVLILLTKVIEVTLGTLRVILISKGYRKEGTILSFFEILLWVFVASTVINGIQEAPIKGVIYSIGFSVGVYLGSKVEGILAFGKLMLQVILSKEVADNVIKLLRDNGYGVTTIDAKGKDDGKKMLMILANRKKHDDIIKLILEIEPKAVIFINEVSSITGGYVKSKKKIFK